ncbi:MAG: DUF805 domain-containing protein [Kiritimatiellae bacterium]|nr:DUF805 domain-containing protein [Kiritimatiellia bacterium]
MNWYLGCWKKYAEFSGRARRQEFWMFLLFNSLAGVVLGVVDGILGTNGGLGGLYSLAVLIPFLAVSVRRLHDTDRSGWWILVNIIPLIGAIILLVFLCSDSKPGENRFGANPKGM